MTNYFIFRYLLDHRAPTPKVKLKLNEGQLAKVSIARRAGWHLPTHGRRLPGQAHIGVITSGGSAQNGLRRVVPTPFHLRAAAAAVRLVLVHAVEHPAVRVGVRVGGWGLGLEVRLGVRVGTGAGVRVASGVRARARGS